VERKTHCFEEANVEVFPVTSDTLRGLYVERNKHALPMCVRKYSKSAEVKWVDQGKDGKTTNHKEGLSPHGSFHPAHDDGDDK
jgi:hypothetical protein